MKTSMLKRVRKNYPHSDMTPPHIVRHNRRAWVRSIRFLGSKWLLALPPKGEGHVHGPR